jgi:hypothetical protein
MLGLRLYLQPIPPGCSAAASRSHDSRRLMSPVSRLQYLALTAIALGTLIFVTGARGEAVQLAHASSPGTVSARVDFRIVVPEVLQLDMRTGDLVANTGRVQTILVTTEQEGVYRTSVNRAVRNSFRRDNAKPTTVSSSGDPVYYTISMP